MGFHAPEMITKIRLRVSDLQKTRYSDYEVLSALNDARTMLWIALAESFSTIPRKRIELTLDADGRAHLPPDYYSLAGISRERRVEGFFVCGPPGVKILLEYNGLPMPSGDLNYTEPSDPLFEVKETPDGAILSYNGVSFPGEDGYEEATTPFSLVLDVVEIAAAILAGNTDAAVSQAASTASRVSGKREHAAIANRRPFS
jgi:hypothetical protein